MKYDEINLLDICTKGTNALGPGLRYAIWTQGCPFDCDNCISPESHSMMPNIIARIQDVAENIISNQQITGISISGGEPFMQASKLALLLELVKAKRPELDVIVFTGYQYDKLTWEDAVRLLGLVDLLIDGPYNDRLNNGKGLRGSTNQSFIFLTDALMPYKEEIENGCRRLEMMIGNNYVKTIGIPNKLEI